MLEKHRPSVFKLAKFATRYAPRQKFGSRSLQSRLRRHLALVKFLKPFAPPGQLNRAERGLRRLRDDIAHRVVDGEERVERGPQFRRPVEPDEIAILQLSDK